MINGNNMYAQSIGTTMQNPDGVFLKEPVPAPDLIEKSITENGEYNASADNADGYSKVTVDVAGGGGETFEVEMTFTVDSTHPDVLNVEVDKTFSETISAIDNGYIINFNITRINGQQTTKSIVYGYKKFLAEDIPFINIMAGSSDGGTGFTVVWVNDSTTATSGNPMPSIVIGTPET